MKKIMIAAVLLAASFGFGESASAGEITHPCLPAICHICVDNQYPFVHYCVFE